MPEHSKPTVPQEAPNEPLSFIEKALSGVEPGRCVDGRPAHKSMQGPQMPGGTFHIVLIDAIDKGKNLTEEPLKNGFEQLDRTGYKPGLHRGHHKHPENNISDCGAADKAKLILTVAQENRAEIIERLRPLYASEGNVLGPIDMLEVAYSKIAKYNPERITITGEQLITKAEELGAFVEEVEGEHGERKAFVNFKKSTSFDTQRANEMGWQAFNLDLAEVIDQAKTLGVDPQIAAATSLVIYVATEMVLVEKYGVAQEHQPPLSVEVYK